MLPSTVFSNVSLLNWLASEDVICNIHKIYWDTSLFTILKILQTLVADQWWLEDTNSSYNSVFIRYRSYNFLAFPCRSAVESFLRSFQNIATIVNWQGPWIKTLKKDLALIWSSVDTKLNANRNETTDFRFQTYSRSWKIICCVWYFSKTNERNKLNKKNHVI